MDGGVACATTLCVVVVVVSTERQTSAFRVIAGGRACVWVGSFMHSFMSSSSYVRTVVRKRGTVADVECVVVASTADDDDDDDEDDVLVVDGFGLTSASATNGKRNAVDGGRRMRRRIVRIARVTSSGNGKPMAEGRARAFAGAGELTPAFASRVAECNLGLVSASASGLARPGGDGRGVRDVDGGRRVAAAVFVVKRRCARIGAEFWVVAAGGAAVESTRATMSFWVSEREGGSDEALKRAVDFTTTAAFDAWSRGSECVAGPKKAGLGGSRERAKKHPYAYRGVMGDDVIDCVCGDNEEYGFMVACETCGAWEHGECCRIYAEEEIPKDYKCLACVRADAKTLLVLDSREEEGDDAGNVKGEKVLVGYDGEDSVDGGFGTVKSTADVLNGEMTVVCCVCGCHDAHGDYSAMVRACSCAGGGAIAHESCMKRWCGKTSGGGKGSNARGRASSKITAATCKACGDHGGLASGISDASDVDDMLRAFAKAIDDTSAKYEAEAMAYRSNPRPRPRSASHDSPSKKENIAKQEMATTTPEKVKTPVAATRDPSKKFEGTPLSMLPLKRRRMMAWDSEQKMRSLSEKMDAKALSENVKQER